MTHGSDRLSRAASLVARVGLALTLLGVLALVLSGLGSRWDWWNFRVGFVIFRWTLYGGLVTVVVALAGLVLGLLARRGRSLLISLVTLVLLASGAVVPVTHLRAAGRVPPIHDITTDPIDPPRFDALAALRTGDGANTAVYAGLYSAEQQRQYYPDIETVELDVPVQRAYEVTLQLVNKRKWLVIDERAPQLPRRIGRIEAVARTPIMGFREDVSIRATPDGEGSRVDIRSSSRYFESDLGSNAARITRLIDDINNAVDNAKPVVKKPVAPAKVQPKVVKK